MRDGDGTVSPSQPYSARQKYRPLGERLGGKSFFATKKRVLYSINPKQWPEKLSDAVVR